MAAIDLSDFCTWEEELPRPKWDLLGDIIQAQVEPDGQFDAWTELVRQWLARLSLTLGSGYQIDESRHFVVMLPHPEVATEPVLDFMERCLLVLSEVLPGVTELKAPGKVVVLALPEQESYYRYLAYHYPEGKHGGSGGIQIRTG